MYVLKNILFRVETEHENKQDIHQALIGILTLLAKSMAELTVEDEWLKGQLTIVNDVLSKPLNILTLGNAESNLKELLHKQVNLNPALHYRQDLIQKLACTFISQLIDMTETTDEHHQKIGKHQHQFAGIDNIDELNCVLQNELEDMRAVGLTLQRTREKFKYSQNKITQAEKKSMISLQYWNILTSSPIKTAYRAH
ncbi:MAG: diguanylate cyclase [Methylophilaceae bacterium]